MTADHLDTLKKRHGYDAWHNRNALPENLFIWNFFLTGTEFHGWQAHRIHPIEQAPAPPLIRSMWKGAEGATDTLLRLDVYQCASRGAAHDFLLQVLDQFQSPHISRRQDAAVGDVCFQSRGGGALVFARANLVAFVGSAGRKLVSVQDAARQLDQHLGTRPSTVSAGLSPAIQLAWGLAPPFVLHASVALQLSATDPLDKPVWYKIFSRLGEVSLQDGKLVYRPTAAGQDQIVAFAVTGDGRVSQQDWSLAVQ